MAAFGGMVGAQEFVPKFPPGEHPHTVALKRILPATVNLNGKRIKVEAINLTSGVRTTYVPPGRGGGVTGDLAILQTKLITAIQKDNRFIVSEDRPETILRFQVTEYYTDQKQKQVGNQMCQEWVGKMEVSYQALEPGSQAPLDSENLTASLTERNQKGPGTFSKVPLVGKKGACNTDSAVSSQHEARDVLMDSIVAQMAQRAAPTEETVIAPVPRGKLDSLAAMAASARWATLLEEAEKMDKFPKPADDSYRVYLIGLANEGLAYDAARDASERERNRRNDMTSPAALQSIAEEDKDFVNAQNYIDKAAKAYKDAIQLKPDEKFFREPDARIEQAVKLYATIMRHKEEYRATVLRKQRTYVAQNNTPPPGPATVDTGSRSVGKGQPKAPAQSAYDRVILMCQQKVQGVSQLIHDHPTDLRFTTALTFDQDVALRRECGADAPNIVNEINAQLRRRHRSEKVKAITKSFASGALVLLSASPLSAQFSDACSPGWSYLNKLKEEVTADTSKEQLAEYQSAVTRRLRLCPEIPDLWYYRYLIDQRLNDTRDANLARSRAAELRSTMLAGNVALTSNKAPAAAPLSKAIHDKWALVVGIGSFQDRSVPALKYTVSDATAFASYLTDPNQGRFAKDHVISLYNGQATLVGIRTAIGELRSKVQPDDLVVVYMASHGSPRESDPNGVSYIITYDTKLDSAANLYATSLQMIDLARLLRNDIKAQRVALVLDTCFSGDATNSRGVSVPAPAAPNSARQFSGALETFTVGGPRVVIAASQGDQQSWETDALKHGYFTYYLLQALEQNGGKVPVEKAFAQARDATKAAVWKDHHAEQAPTIQESDNGGALVLGAPPG